MGMNEQDGGRAFPAWELNGNDRPEMTEFGMSLRDYFAAKAMTSVVTEACRDEAWKSGEDWRVGVALDCYKMADAMLIARKRGTGQVRDEAPEPEPFRITGPGVYRNRGGQKFHVHRNPNSTENEVWDYEAGAFLVTVHANGRCWLSTEGPYDIVERIS